jgi:hypothetical protein
MSCSHCTQPIEEGARILETPCCGIKFHSACGIQKLGQACCHFASVYCDCGALLYQHAHYQSEAVSHANLAEVRAKPGVAAELKALKTKNTLVRKSLVVYQKYLKEKKAEFYELVDSQIEAVKLAKATKQAEVKNSEPFKAYRKLQAGLKTLQSKFQKAHELTRYEMKELIGTPYHGTRWGPWASRPLYMLTRGFRIRL